MCCLFRDNCSSTTVNGPKQASLKAHDVVKAFAKDRHDRRRRGKDHHSARNRIYLDVSRFETVLCFPTSQMRRTPPEGASPSQKLAHTAGRVQRFPQSSLLSFGRAPYKVRGTHELRIVSRRLSSNCHQNAVNDSRPLAATAGRT